MFHRSTACAGSHACPAEDWSGPWNEAVQVLEGHKGYEAYALVLFKLPGWRPGLYMALAAFFSAYTLLVLVLTCTCTCKCTHQLSCHQFLVRGPRAYFLH